MLSPSQSFGFLSRGERTVFDFQGSPHLPPLTPPSQGGERDRSLATSFHRAPQKHVSRNRPSSSVNTNFSPAHLRPVPEPGGEYWTVSGCDIAAGPCQYARDDLGLDVCCADFLDLPLEKGDIDAVCLWDTIEHLGTPDLYLERMAERLLLGGIVALTTGDIGAILVR